MGAWWFAVIGRLLVFSTFAALASVASGNGVGGDVQVYFPINAAAPDAPTPNSCTAWKITWDETYPPVAAQQTSIQPTNTLYLKDVQFARSFQVVGGKRVPQWVTVLDDVRLSDIVVDYDNGPLGSVPVSCDITDGHGYLDDSGGGLGPACLACGRILKDTLGKPVVREEFRDDGVRWAQYPPDSNGQPAAGKPIFIQRGQEMVLWGISVVGTYEYITEFHFRDDGVITLSLGATGHNADGAAPHSHTALWRLQPNLSTDKAPGDASVKIELVRRSLAADYTSERSATNLNFFQVEGGISWRAKDYTALRMIGSARNPQANSNNPVLNLTDGCIAYDLVAQSHGRWLNPSVGEYATEDIWVTKLYPFATRTPLNPTFKDLPTYIGTSPESLEDQALVVWYACSTYHDPRQEDMMADGVTPGATLTMWSSFELKPFNLFGSTPLYPFNGWPSIYQRESVVVKGH